MYEVYMDERFRKIIIEQEDFVAIIETHQRDMEPDDMELIAMVARTLWLRRNVVVHGGIFSHPTIIIIRVMIGRGHLPGPCPALSYVERTISVLE
jgi:hypothetical protein